MHMHRSLMGLLLMSSAAVLRSSLESSGGTADSAETGFFSLADLAEMNTDAVQTILTRVPNAGLFRVKGLSVIGKEGESQDGKPPLHRFNFTYEIIGGKPTDKNVDIETLNGRRLTESYTLWPKQIGEIVGLLKGRYQKVGLPNSGMPMGGVEGKEPGWLDTMVGHEFDLRVRTFNSKGETRAAFDWMPPDAKAAGAEQATS